jgi:HD-GYP domain-containing protein (c-di-GMP phosphodiesterase class II)
VRQGAFEAITTDRCYRAARTPQIAREELLREAGHQFDPVVEAFLQELDQPQASMQNSVEVVPAWGVADEVTARFAQLLDAER